MLYANLSPIWRMLPVYLLVGKLVVGGVMLPRNKLDGIVESSLQNLPPLPLGLYI